MATGFTFNGEASAHVLPSTARLKKVEPAR